MSTPPPPAADPNAQLLLAMPTLLPVIRQLKQYYEQQNQGEYAALLDRAATAYQSTPAPVASLPALTTALTAPPVPDWVKGDPLKSSSAKRIKAATRNAQVVADANRAKTRYDFVLYGDSITQFVADKYMDIWKQYFGHLKSAPLGIGGNTVEELSWRLVRGKERFDRPPRVVGILIGINNLKWAKNDPAEKLDFLLPWLRATWPDTKVILLNVLPNATVKVGPTNAKYKRLAEKYGVQFATCGADINPTDTSQLKDGTHPAPAGYHKVYSCLRPLVDSALQTRPAQ